MGHSQERLRQGGQWHRMVSKDSRRENASYEGQAERKLLKIKQIEEQVNKAETLANSAKESAESAKQESTVAKNKADAAALEADKATQTAEEAKAASLVAQKTVDGVKESVAEIKQTAENAKISADSAKETAVNAQAKANEATQAAANAQTAADEAAEQAKTAQSTADTAVEKAGTAQSTADTAKQQAATAQATVDGVKKEVADAQAEIDGLGESLETLSNTMTADYAKKTNLTSVEASLDTKISQNAAQISSNAQKLTVVDETANNAKEQAETAQKTAEAAKTQAEAATSYAVKAQSAADAAALAASKAQSEADKAKVAASTAQGVADKANTDLAAAKAELESVTSRVGATEEEIAAAQTAVDNAQAAADKAAADAQLAATKAANAQTTADTAKANAETAKNTADAAASAASAAQEAADAAQGDATAAKDAADKAAAAAGAAQLTADTAKTNAATAQAKADSAASAAASAQKVADTAKANAETAQKDLDTAKKNLADVTSRVDATEEDILAAQTAVNNAQAAADKAKLDAANAQNTADTAKTNAANAQAAADKAKTAADNAQAAADSAKEAADKAQADADALAIRVTKAETQITQNAEAIELRATKEEVTKTLGGYYTKEQADAAIEVRANSIESVVKSTYATKTEIDVLQQQIDGAVETFSGSSVPTLSNEPANVWTTNKERDTHIGDLYIVNSDGGSYAGFYYRFEKVDGVYRWTLLKDNEITKALQDAKEANEKANKNTEGIKELSTSITQTNEKLTSEVKRVDDMGKKVTTLEQTASGFEIRIDTVENNAIVGEEEEYYQSTSATALSGGSWSTNQPTWAQGKYIFKRTKITYGDGRTEYNPNENGVCVTGNTGATGAKGDTGATGTQGYSLVTYVSRETFTEDNWSTYGTIGHEEGWPGTEDIRNGCRVGDLFAVVGTATDTKNSHMLVYRSDNASGRLHGACISHVITPRGATGATGAAGKGVKTASVTYQISNSSTTVPTGTWVDAVQKTTSEQPYLWTRTITTYTDNTTTTSYSVSSTIEGITIGGRNLYVGGSKWRKDTPATTGTSDDAYLYLDGASAYLEKGKIYTLQAVCDLPWSTAHGSGAGAGKGTIWIASSDRKYHRVFVGDGVTSGRYAWTFTHEGDGGAYNIRVNGYAKATKFWDIKIESGNKATDWTPAPEDVDESVDSASKTATSYMSYDGTNGLQIGDKTSGSWKGCRTQIKPDSFNILDSSGEILSSYGAKRIKIGANAEEACIDFCDSRGEVSYGELGVGTILDDNKYFLVQSQNVGFRTGLSGRIRLLAQNSSGEYGLITIGPHNNVEIQATEYKTASDGTPVWSGAKLELLANEKHIKATGSFEIDGNLSGKYISGTWLQTSQTANLNKKPNKIAVIDDSGWIYFRTPEQLIGDIGALSTSGGTLTGNIAISAEDLPSLVLKTESNGSAFVQAGTNDLVLLSTHDGTQDNSRQIVIFNSNGRSDVKMATQFHNVVGGTSTAYNLHGGHNKTSGTYTGNGSAASRTIYTGGIGNVVFITSNKGTAILSNGSGIVFNSDGVTSLLYSAAHFIGGTLTIASTSNFVNASGVTYTYQVL